MIDPDLEERRDGRISDAIGIGAVILTGLVGAAVGGLIVYLLRGFGLFALLAMAFLGYAGAFHG